MEDRKQKRILVLWRPDAYAEVLKSNLGLESVVTSFEELSQIDFKESHYLGIVILAELTWENHKFSDLFGIEIAKIIRVEKRLRLPIVFVSFLPLSQLRLDDCGKEILDRQIIGVIGHDYLSLPSLPQLWTKRLGEMQSLNNLQFADVINSFCNLKGLIAEAIHQLKNRCRVLLNKRGATDRPRVREVVAQVFDEIADLLGEIGEARNKKVALLSQFDFEAAEDDAIQAFLTASEDAFKSLVAADDFQDDSRNADAERQAWKVLILDDEPEGLAALVSALDKRGVQSVIVESVAEAERQIAKDCGNEITVAISDYRLLETIDGLTKHQPKQGYDFLLDLRRRRRFTSLVALSGLSRRFLLESFRKYNTRVEVYSKNDLNGKGAVSLFADNILDVGREQYEALCAQPNAREWDILKQFYVAHRQAADYEFAERLICDRARRIAVQIEAILRQGDKEWLLNPQLPEFENLQERMNEKVSDEDEMNEMLPIFRNKLTARRLAVWLHLGLGFEPWRVFLALNGELLPDKTLGPIKDGLRTQGKLKGENWAESIEANAWAKLKNRAKQPLKFLALSLSELPEGLLVEEKAWLSNDMGIDLNDPQTFDQTCYWVQKAAEDWCDGNPELVEQLAGSCDLVSAEGVPTITSWKDAKRFLVAVRSLIASEDHQDEFQSLLGKIQTGVSSDKSSPILVAEFQELLKQISLM